jgi:TonB family protein
MDSLQIGVTWRLPLRALNDVKAENARGETVTASDAGGEMPAPMTSRVMTFGDYPTESVRDNEHGTVDLRYLIQNDGNVGVAEVISSSGIPRLDNAAVRMVQQRWKFRPATKDGKPIAMWRNARVAFQLTQAIPTPRECRDQPLQKTERVPAPSFWDGSLVVRRQVFSDETGQILDALLLTGKGWKRLERDILQLGHPAHFEPAPTKNGKPSRCWFDADITLSKNELMKLSLTRR